MGLCSYLLISFWYTRIQANKSAIKALVINRISDFGFTIGIIVIFYTFQSADFSVVFPIVPFFSNQSIIICDYTFNTLNLMGFLLFTGAMGKSAQLGLHT